MAKLVKELMIDKFVKVHQDDEIFEAANRVAEDMGAAKWWKPTKEMEKFVKTYLEV